MPAKSSFHLEVVATPQPDPFKRVVAERFNAVIHANKARFDWLVRVGIQPPLQFAWLLSRATRLTRCHRDCLEGGCFDSLKGSEPSAPTETGTAMFDPEPQCGRRPEGCVRKLYTSLRYSLVNYELIASLAEEEMSAHQRETLNRSIGEISRLLEALETFEPSLIKLPEGELRDFQVKTEQSCQVMQQAQEA